MELWRAKLGNEIGLDVVDVGSRGGPALSFRDSWEAPDRVNAALLRFLARTADAA